jgi:endonuclease-3
MKPAQVRDVFERLQAQNPHPVTELEHSSPFELLVAVILSAQATDKGVNIATRKLFPVANTPAQILALGTDGLTDYVKSIGLYPAKVKNILATCQLLLDKHGGEVPRDRAALEALAGVGRKTANVVLNSAFGMPTMPVDTHIFRLLRVIPPEYLLHAHHWLLLHGRYVCTARSPQCPRCPLVDLCPYKDKTLPLPSALPFAANEAPAKARRAAAPRKSPARKKPASKARSKR